MATNSGYTLQDLLVGIGAPIDSPTGGIYTKLANRDDIVPIGLQPLADAVLDISTNYPFEDLQETGPRVTLNQGQFEYDLSYFVNTTDPISMNKAVNSFFMFYERYNQGVLYNPGTGLTYKDVSSLELMFYTPGQPAYWSRHANKIYIAPVPIRAYDCYFRYQRQHPFSKPAALTDTILLPDDWREIIEYSGAYRIASNLRMLDYAQGYKVALYGDPKKPGDLGLLSARITQMESDIVSNQATRQMRPMRGY